MRAAATAKRGKAFGEYATGWLETRTLKVRTRQGYSELLTGPLATFQKLPVNMISTEAVRTWFAGLPSSTPTKNAHGYQLLRAILNTALADSLITSNPCVIRGAGTTETKREAIILTPDQVAKVAAEVPPNLKALVLLAAWAGLRWGEVTALTRADLSADCTEVHASRAVTHRAGICTVSTPKNGKVRSVLLPPHIVADVRDHLAHFVGAQPDALLFVAPKACHYNERTFRDIFAAACRGVGITEIPAIHHLRHFAGSQTARVANLAETMARLGHSTSRASLKYQHRVSGRDAEIAEALSKLAAVIEDGEQ